MMILLAVRRGKSRYGMQKFALLVVGSLEAANDRAEAANDSFLLITHPYRL